MAKGENWPAVSSLWVLKGENGGFWGVGGGKGLLLLVKRGTLLETIGVGRRTKNGE